MRTAFVSALALLSLSACSLGQMSVAMRPPSIEPDCMDRIVQGGYCQVAIAERESAGSGISGSPVVSVGRNRAIGPGRLRTDLF